MFGRLYTRFGLLAAVLLVTAMAVSAEVIDNFDKGASAWHVEQKGAEGCVLSGADGALRVDFDLNEGRKEVTCYTESVANLAFAASLKFDVKGEGDYARIYLTLWDSQGRSRKYGPPATNLDFTSDCKDWHTCILALDSQKPAEDAGADMADIQRIGFAFNRATPRKGTVFIDSLEAVEGPVDLKCGRAFFSPNGDGIYDTVDFDVLAKSDSKLLIEARDSSGNVVATIINGPATGRKTHFTWDGLRKGVALPNDNYRIAAKFEGAETKEIILPVTLSNWRKWPPLKYTAEPFFPIGVWFEGAPSLGEYPEDPEGARAYYERCFSDLAAHGFNAVTLTNLPENLWEPALQVAQTHGLKVIFDIGQLVQMVSGPKPVIEQDVFTVVKRVTDKIGKYESLLRYQIRDEPPPDMIPNWLVVQRVLAAVDPKHPAFSCFADAGSLMNLASQTQLSEFVYDIYPQFENTPPQTINDYFLTALNVYSSIATGHDSWIVLQTFSSKGRWRLPSVEEVRCMTYMSLAKGVKGAYYFIYQTMPKRPDLAAGLVDPEGKSTPLYDATSVLAKELGKLAPLIKSLTPATPVPNIAGEAIAGRFADKDGQSVIIVASKRPDIAVTARVRGIATGYEDALTGEKLQSKGGILDVPLGPGCGRVLVAIAKP